MPTRIRSKRTAQRARKNSLRRKNQQAKRRKRANRPKPKAPSVIANSIFALTLDPKPGFEVQNKLEKEIDRGWRKEQEFPDDYNKMYRDLLPCFTNAYRILYGEPIRFSPLKDGLPIGLALSSVIDAFKQNILPFGFQFNIDRRHDHGEYYFTIYKQYEFPWVWHTFEIKYVIQALQKRKPALLRLFIQFLKSFAAHCRIQFWYQGDVESGDQFLEDRINNYEEWETDEEDEIGEHNERISEMRETLDSYRDGEIYGWRQEISRAKVLTPGEIRAKLRKYSRKNSIVGFMYLACDLMDMPYSAEDFTYDPQDEDRQDFGMEGVWFFYQMAILWDETDDYCSAYAELLDSTAQNGGVFPPIIHKHIGKETKAIDIEWLKEAYKWPKEFHQLFRDYAKAENPYRPKNKKHQIK